MGGGRRRTGGMDSGHEELRGQGLGGREGKGMGQGYADKD